MVFILNFIAFSIFPLYFWLSEMNFYMIKIFNWNSFWKARFERCWSKIDSFGLNLIHLFKTIRNHQKEQIGSIIKLIWWISSFQHIFSFFHFNHQFYQISIFIHLTISHHNIFIQNQIYFHRRNIGRDLMKKI